MNKLFVMTLVALALFVMPAQALAAEVIGHRGSAYRPENTLASYRNAVYHGARIIEADFHCTSDGILVAHHDYLLDRTTTGGGPVEDTSYAAIKGLRAQERWPAYRRRSASYDGQFRIPTMAKVLRWVEATGVQLRFDSKTRNCEDKVLRKLQAAHERGADIVYGPVDQAQRRKANDTTDLPLNIVVLPDEADTDTDGRLETFEARALVTEVDQLSNAVSFSVRADLVTPELVERAHRQGLRVGTWTIRAQHGLQFSYGFDRSYWTCTSGSFKCRRKRGRTADWVQRFVDMGVDEIIADEPNHTGLAG